VTHRTCSIDGCDSPTRTGGAEWCAKHYHRWYRHGDVHRTAHNTRVGVKSGGRYVTTDAPGHPMTPRCGKAYVHRIVLFDAIGYGPHSCHWCDRPIDWNGRNGVDGLFVDHLNNMRNDNRLENLAPSCHACNSSRGSQRRRQALADAGWWSNNDTVAAIGGRVGFPSAA